MYESEYDQIEKYIKSTGIDDETRRLISDFTILWNRYERELFDNFQQPKKVHSKIEGLNFAFNPNVVPVCFEQMVEYVKKRTTFDVDGLIKYFNIRPNDINNREELRRIIEGKNDVDKLHFLLLIAARVRNNMFHGLKELKDLNHQKELFEICNIALKMVLDAKGFSMLNFELEIG